MEKLGSPEPACPAPGAGPVAGVSVAKRAGVEGDEAAVSSKLFRSACIRRWLPLAYREELYHVLRLTGPLTMNVTTSAAGHGLAVACDTLISQTFGGKNMKRVGVILQRSSLILLLFCLPCWALVINSHNILLLLHQDAEVARIAQIYIMAFLPAFPAMFLHLLQVTYLQNQGIILPQMYTAAAANIFNLAANYILISSLQLGVIGSAIANSLSQIVTCLMLFYYIKWKKLHQQTWGGWSMECLQEWGSYMKLAVPSTFMVCFEWWIYEIGGFLAGVIAVLQGIVIAGCKSVIGHIFTTDLKIVTTVSDNLTVYIFLQFFDALLCVCTGILVGAGMQKIAAVSNLVGYYFIGLPVGIALMFYTDLRIIGLWLGTFVGIFLEAGFILILIFKINWEKAQVRAGTKVVVIPKRPVSTILNEATVPDISDPTTARFDGEEAPKGYNPVNTQDQELKEVPKGNDINPRGTEGDVERNKNTLNTKSEELLSNRQLILRRGLIAFVSVLILIIGIALHFAFPAPEPPVKTMANFTLNWGNDSTPTPLAALDMTTNL
ncbi:Multidrug and toxin extrusion protein 1 [Nibea albiflora]|uniref:Multidrug and toxin extrusion protein 1 n=1 Tax=Nibea albiflora TaxID=240163 RepID=A0ACB7F2Q0_NIBAL|nr:Multidrug and toxin extrusion protein 1 [Nibea albiflora]